MAPFHGGNGGRQGPQLLLLLVAAVAFMLGVMVSVVLKIQSCKEAFAETIAGRENPAAVLKTAENHPEICTLPSDFFEFSNKCREAAPVERVRSLLLNDLFDGVSPFDGFPQPHVEPLLRKENIKGWGSQASVFEDLLKEVRPQLVVELGTFLGASAIHMANLSESMGFQSLILCVDDFRGWPGFRQTVTDVHQVNGQVVLYFQFLQNVISSNKASAILPLPFSTTSTLSKLCELGIQADLIEVDASHDFHSVWAELNLAWPLLKPKTGIMFGHDYYHGNDNRGVARAVHLFARLKGLEVHPHGEHWIFRTPRPGKRKLQGGQRA